MILQVNFIESLVQHYDNVDEHEDLYQNRQYLKYQNHIHPLNAVVQFFIDANSYLYKCTILYLRGECERTNFIL